jgi:hypothetical protein
MGQLQQTTQMLQVTLMRLQVLTILQGVKILTVLLLLYQGLTAIVDFADEVFSNVTTSAAGCIIYNSSASNKAIAVIDFGGTVSATAGDLTIEFPAAGASTGSHSYRLK